VEALPVVAGQWAKVDKDFARFLVPTFARLIESEKPAVEVRETGRSANLRTARPARTGISPAVHSSRFKPTLRAIKRSTQGEPTHCPR